MTKPKNVSPEDAAAASEVLADVVRHLDDPSPPFVEPFALRPDPRSRT